MNVADARLTRREEESLFRFLGWWMLGVTMCGLVILAALAAVVVVAVNVLVEVFGG